MLFTVNEVHQLHNSIRFRYNESRTSQWLGVSVDSHNHGNGSIIVSFSMWNMIKIYRINCFKLSKTPVSGQIMEDI